MSKTKKVLFVIVLNLAIVAMEIIYGLAANSISLIADAVHNLGDVLAVIVTFIAIVLGARAASESMTFGYLRAEMMAGFINSLFLVVSMGYLLYESFDRLLHPEAVQSEYMMIIASVALLANGLSALLLHRIGREFAHHHDDHEGHHGHRHDLNLRSAYLHMLSDALISLGVIIGGAAIYFFGIPAIDPLLSILFSLYILKEALGLLKQTFLSLMDINTDDLKEIESLMRSFESVHSIHDLHLYRPSSKTMYLTSHLVFDEELTLAQTEAILVKIRQALKKAGVTHSVLQPETECMAQENIFCSRHA